MVDNAALLARLNAEQPLSVVLDVWGGANRIFNVALLEAVDIGVAYCRLYAGGSARGTTGSLRAYSARLYRSPSSMSRWRHYCLRLSLVVLRFTAAGSADAERLAHLVYDVRRDDAPLRKSRWNSSG